MSAGARGVSAAQDPKFLNKERKLLKTLKFPKEYDRKVDLTRVNWEVCLSWPLAACNGNATATVPQTSDHPCKNC